MENIKIEKVISKIVWVVMGLVMLSTIVYELYRSDEPLFRDNIERVVDNGADDIVVKYLGEFEDSTIDGYYGDSTEGINEGINEGVNEGVKGGLIEYMNAVGFRESSNNYGIVNEYGYQGRYQIGKMAMKDLGIKGGKSFLNDHKLQDDAFKALLSINKYRLRNYITKYENTYINGIKITESGLLGAAHLVGARSVKKYLRSGGKKVRKDGNGTSLEEYLELFGGYELGIVAKRKIKL